LRLGKVCVAIQAGSPAELMDRAETALKDSKFLEFRLDSLPKPASALMYLKQFLAEHREVTAIGTCRRKAHGGGFDAPLATELEILTKAAQAGCQIIDLEIESAEECKPAQLAKLRTAGAALMISFHDFTRTKGLDQAADRIEAFKPDFVKVVSTARTLADNLAVLRLIEDRSLASHVIGIAMGEEGIVSRVLSLRAGAAFTFASFSGGTETAPGQMTAETMRDLYRLEHLDQAFPQRPLAPESVRDRALAHVIEDWADESLYFYEVLIRLAWPQNVDAAVELFAASAPDAPRDLLRKTMLEGGAALTKAQGVGRKPVEQVVADLERHFQALDGMLDGRDWLVGDRLSSADLAAIGQVNALLFAQEARAAFSRTRHVAAWMARVDAAAPKG